MKSKKLLKVMGEIEDKYILEAAPDCKKRQSILKWIAVAACIAIVFSVGAALLLEKELPALTINDCFNEGMGFEGYYANSADELQNNNPWQKGKVTKLPVYENTLHKYTDEWTVTEPNTEKMKQLLTEAAEALEMDVAESEIETNIPEGYTAPYSCWVENENYKIEVNAWLRVNIEVKNNAVLPNGCNLCNATYEEAQKSAEYLQNKFANLLNMKKPTADIALGDYDIEGERRWELSFYDSAGSTEEQVMSYGFDRVHFYGFENGVLSSISYGGTECGRKLGEYSVITEEKAVELLCDGKYFSSIADEFPGKENIKKTELIYCTETRSTLFMPYYKFYVEMVKYGVEEQNLSCFVTFYVPAVEEKYIENMPLWEKVTN
ncbi:MAG: hypothetical protein IJF27_08105 [Oscillospiraceae bacterium]|nr:hypothetical protein [Oscillospiraceae bacterium]